MENRIQIEPVSNQNWFVKKIKKYQVITFTFGFLLILRFTALLIGYSTDKDLFLQTYVIDFWFWAIIIPIIYFLQWLLVVWVASNNPKDKLQQKFIRHPIATIVLFILYVTDLPYRLAVYGGNIINIFETIIYYAFVTFLWWLLVCWISSKIFIKQRFEWFWYKKIIGKLFVVMPFAYKIVFGLIIAFLLFFIIFSLLTVVFKYSGEDLKMLFS